MLLIEQLQDAMFLGIKIWLKLFNVLNFTLQIEPPKVAHSAIHKAAGLPIAGRNALWRGFLLVAPFTANGHFSIPQELYQSKSATALPAAL